MLKFTDILNLSFIQMCQMQTLQSPFFHAAAIFACCTDLKPVFQYLYWPEACVPISVLTWSLCSNICTDLKPVFQYLYWHEACVPTSVLTWSLCSNICTDLKPVFQYLPHTIQSQFFFCHFLTFPIHLYLGSKIRKSDFIMTVNCKIIP